MIVLTIARIVITLLLAALLAVTGGGKLAGVASSRAIRDSLRLSAGRWRAIGVFEVVTVIVLVVGVWVVPASIAGSAAVILLMIGAIVVRVRAGGEQRAAGARADAVVLAVGVVGLVLGVLGFAGA